MKMAEIKYAQITTAYSRFSKIQDIIVFSIRIKEILTTVEFYGILSGYKKYYILIVT